MGHCHACVCPDAPAEGLCASPRCTRRWGECALPRTRSYLLPRLKRNESASSVQNYFHLDSLQKKLKDLEEENVVLRSEVTSAPCSCPLWGAAALSTHPPSQGRRGSFRGVLQLCGHDMGAQCEGLVFLSPQVTRNTSRGHSA